MDNTRATKLMRMIEDYREYTNTDLDKERNFEWSLPDLPEVTYLPDGYTLTEVRAPSYLNMTTATTNTNLNMTTVTTQATNLKDAYDAMTSYPYILKQASYQYNKDDEVDQFRDTADAMLRHMNISQRESGILINSLIYLIFYNSYVCLNFKFGLVYPDPTAADTADIVLRADLRDDERLILKEVYISIKEFIEKTFTGLVKLDTSTVVENTIDALVEEVLWKLTYGEDPLFQDDLDRYAALWGIC